MKKILAVLVGATIIYTGNALGVDRETYCLAKNVYHEARGESWQGKMAVAITTLNRTNHWQFPKTICRVVYQPGQFQWTYYKNLSITDHIAWQDSLLIAHLAQELIHEFSNFPALYFHNNTVRPRWRLRRLATIGSHTFYH